MPRTDAVRQELDGMVENSQGVDLRSARVSSDAHLGPSRVPLSPSGPCSPEQLDDCYRRYRRYFVVLVHRRFRVSWHDAEDIVQDAFTLAVIKVRQIQHPTAWIRGTVDRLSIGQARLRSRRASAVFGIGLASAAFVPEPSSPCSRILDAIHEVFGPSADFAREMLVEGETMRAVAGRVGVPEGTVYYRICMLRRRGSS